MRDRNVRYSADPDVRMGPESVMLALVMTGSL
jgi:hypothetical protein